MFVSEQVVFTELVKVLSHETAVVAADVDQEDVFLVLICVH